MYKLFSNGVMLGYAEQLNYIKLGDNGCFVPCDKSVAQGVAYKSTAYSLNGGLPTQAEIVIADASVDEINTALNVTRADLDYVMMMTDTAIPVDEEVVAETKEVS